MKKMLVLATAIGTAAALGAVPASAGSGRPTTAFEVTITNVSEPGLLDTDRAGGTVPLSPGVFAVAAGARSPMFREGGVASFGIEALAEDGATGYLLEETNAVRRVSVAGVLSPGAPLFAGDSTTFTVTASPGERLFLATMFVQSNDLFFADDGHGIRLFDGATPISGDVTSMIDLWDSGTEVDTAPGTGPDQKPVKDGLDGPVENSVVLLAGETGDGFDLPADEQVIRVTITPVG